MSKTQEGYEEGRRERFQDGANDPFSRLVRALTRLPGIGEKSASRLALFILREKKGLISDLIEVLTIVRERLRFCRECQNLCEEELCSICQDATRNRKIICVVQEPVDLWVIEKSGQYKGLYQVLHGGISPIESRGPDDVRLDGLYKRLQEGDYEEVILATNPNQEGETTALYLRKTLSAFVEAEGSKGRNIKVTRLASGLPVGGTIEYTDGHTLAEALEHRRSF